MTTSARLHTLRYGLHASVSDFTSTPSLVRLQPTDEAASFMRRQRSVIERPLSSTDNRAYEHVRGGKDVSPLTLALEFKGVNSNTGGAVSDWEAKMEQGYLLRSIFGAVGVATTGAAPTVAAAGHTPASGILEVVGTTLANGNVIAFATTSGMQIGTVASGGGSTTITLAQKYSGTPTTGATVIRLGVYAVDPDLCEHVHAMFSSEHNEAGTGLLRTDYFGCAPMSMELGFPNTGLITMSSQWGPSNWSAVAPGSPSHAAPTAGRPCVVDGLTFKIGGTAYILRNATINVDNAVEMRPAGSSPNGVIGGVCGTTGPKLVTFSGEVYFGGAGAIADIAEATGTPDLGDLDGSDSDAGDLATTYDVELFNGASAGGLVYARAPAMDLRATIGQSNGMLVARLTGRATGSSPFTLAVG